MIKSATFCFFLVALAVNCQGKDSIIVHPDRQQTSQKQTIDYSTRPKTYDLSKVIYSSKDSARVVELLHSNITGNDVLWFSRQLISVPYVASTLEIADPERLVVNLTQLDCTTLVETAIALAITYREKENTFNTFCRNLERIRYRKGHIDGYLSRNHYFTWWIHDNIEKGLIENICNPKYFTAKVNVQDYYMSQNPSQYKFLKAHPEWVDSIRSMERNSNGFDGYYLPEQKTSLTKRELGVIHNGDIIAIVTTKKGLDYSHLGIAVWGQDGKLHLINASSIHHKVVEEPKTLYQYLKEHPSSIGIRVLRLK